VGDGARRAERLLSAALATPGFLPEAEALALYRAARRAARSGHGPLLEVGAYLGRSTLVLAAAIAAAHGSTVCFSVDHHHGSEEKQAGWADHDPDLVDPRTGEMDSLPRWRARIDEVGARDLVVGVVGDSPRIARAWRTPLALVFLDGGHGEEIAWADFRGWSPAVAPGGLLVIHDVFEDPAAGGRPPYECYRAALDSGEFLEDPAASCSSLRVLVRVPA
jgi:MMP 1-O-methyltransferase